jgi:hypothetical protein
VVAPTVILHKAKERTLEDGGGVGKLVQGQEQTIQAGLFGTVQTGVFF